MNIIVFKVFVNNTGIFIESEPEPSALLMNFDVFVKSNSVAWKKIFFFGIKTQKRKNREIKKKKNLLIRKKYKKRRLSRLIFS